ncbi:MAG: dihydropteroate synthase, partial [Patescibacteria group bacterium]
MQLQQYKTTLMGILNVTPDSFFDGGKHFDKLEYTIAQVKQMVIDGADIIDIGGESSRPGAEPVSIEEELRRVIPIIEALAKEITAPISIDTYKPQVAKTALQAGAKMLNDITGFKNPDMI